MAGRAEAFKEKRDMPDDAVTLDYVADKLVIWGSPQKVADELLAFRDEVGDFGTLLYAGKDWLDRDLGPPLHGADGREGAAGAECRDRRRQEGGGVDGFTSPWRGEDGTPRT